MAKKKVAETTNQEKYKIAIIELYELEINGYDCYSDQYDIARHITEWTEVTESQLNTLRRFCGQFFGYHRKIAILEQKPEEIVIDTVQQCLKLAETEEKKRHKEEAERLAKKKEKEAKKKQKTIVQREKLYQQLKEEFEANED